MPQAIPFIIAGATVAATASSISSGQQQAKASKQAAADAQAQNAAAIQSVKDAQSSASTKASDSIKRRVASASQSIYTSPLGLTGQAETSKKVLLGN